MSERRPGQWPVDNPADLGPLPSDEERYVQRAAERALHEIVMDSIRHDLEQQPSPFTVLNAARVWCNRITAAAEEIAKAKRSTA
ncbi:hypothetical protein [Streptomyces flaveolus]|uniref:Uncharacterized protein n=1 Tax=Streptomyces flaveolus TaxID=67297 RepID=A0ABV3A802_9ACTN